MSSAVSLVDQLPACQRCKTRKTRCDRLGPKCSHCVHARSVCIVVDPSTGENYTRGYIHELELKEKELLAQLHGGESSRSTTVTSDRSNAGEPPSGAQHVSENPSSAGGFVGESSGLGLLRSILGSTQWRQRKSGILKKLSQRAQIPEMNVSANPTPPLEESQALIQNYFSRFHTHHRFLLSDEIWESFERVYHSPTCSQQDWFRLFMICAISGVTRYRNGLTSAHPYGYFLAAQAHLKGVPLVGSSDAIQNLLLIARFGMYYHIGTSLWEIAGLCIRQCIELGYHDAPAMPLTAIQEQKQRLIFWECYVLDRYSSSILGRPFAIADEDVTVALPWDVDDETIKSAHSNQSLLEFESAGRQSCEPSEASVFVFCIRLRRISSAVHTEFFNPKRKSSGTATPVLAGKVHVRLQHFLTQLHDWRRHAPVFPNPRSLYERSEWHDFLLQKDVLALVKGAMGMAPRGRNNMPDDELLRLCLDAAIQVIELYSILMEKRAITWTRSYFQIIFTAGLSVINCISLSRQYNIKLVGGGSAAVKTLQRCSEILQHIALEMGDARNFADVFAELMDGLLAAHGGTNLHHSGIRAPDAPFCIAEGVATDGLIQRYGDAARVSGLATPQSVGWQPNAQSVQQQAENPTWFDEWPVLATELLEDIQLDLGEYAWGWFGDDQFTSVPT